MDAIFILQIPAVAEWLGGIQPAWALLDPRDFDALSPPSKPEQWPLRFARDFTQEETSQSPIARNMLVLLRAAADGPGLKLTATGNLSRAVVLDMIDRFNWPEYQKETMSRYAKHFNEPDYLPLRLIHGLALTAGLLRKFKGLLKITKAGERILKQENPAGLQAELVFQTFWRLDLTWYLWGRLDGWPQRDAGVVLWSLSVAASDWQTAEYLTKTCTVPIPDMFGRQWDPSFGEMRSQFLRMLTWFGLMEYRDGDIEPGHYSPTRYYRKTPLFDRLLTFDVRLRHSNAARH